MVKKVKDPFEKLLSEEDEKDLNENVRVYDTEEEGEGDLDMDAGSDEAELDLDAVDDVELDVEVDGDDVVGDEGDADVADLIAQLKDVIDGLEDMDGMGADDELEIVDDEPEFGADDADLEFDAASEGDSLEGEEEYVEEMSEADEEEEPLEEGVAKADPSGGEMPKKAIGTNKAGKAATGGTSTDDDEFDAEEANEDTAENIEKSARTRSKDKHVGKSAKGAKVPGADLGGPKGKVGTTGAPKEGSKSAMSPHKMEKPGAWLKKLHLDHTEIAGDISKELSKIIKVDSTLSEEAQRKVAKLFENAVNKKLEIVTKVLAEKYSKAAEQAVDEKVDQLVERVDQYFDYIADEYVSKNELAIQEGLKNRLSDSFLKGLANLFNEHHVAVPEGKVDLVEQLEGKVTALEERTNKLYDTGSKLRRENIALRKERVLDRLTEDLSKSEKAKLKTLVEGVEYRRQKEYAAKVKQIKETHFATKERSSSQEFDTLTEQTDKKPSESQMDQYLKYL